MPESSPDDGPGPKRRRGREARRAARQSSATLSTPYFVRSTAPYEVLNEEGLSLIEANAERILQEIGIEI
ncbi:MAG: trimethylamine methyltransferase family protein, partial [Alphaproteobacteria bacterium]|nr:trimethylamine methyltransferase family protein [Alphaproteobacteria bacterium]